MKKFSDLATVEADEVKELEDNGIWEIRDVPVSELTIDEDVQREALNEHRVRKMVKEFDPNALGIITVSDRGHGEKIIIDGMHRSETVRRVSSGAGLIKARVFVGLTRQEEARLFLALNNGVQPNLYDKYRVGVTGGVDEYSEIDAIVRSMGFSVGAGRTQGNINAIAALTRIYRMKYRWGGEENDPYAGATILMMALKVIKQAWGNEEYALKATALEAVAKVIREYSQLDVERLVSSMRSTKGGPANLTSRALGYASSRSIRNWQAFGQILVDEYNATMGSRNANKLGPFAPR